MNRALLVAGAGSLIFLGAAPPSVDEPIFDAMRAEMARSTKELHLAGADAPYYVGYWVVDLTARDVDATLGAVVSDSTDRERLTRTEVRVGSRAHDNSNYSGSSSDSDFVVGSEAAVPQAAPLDDDVIALRRELWLSTDAAYKDAVETYARKSAAKESHVDREEIASFSDDHPANLVVKDEPVAAATDPDELARHVSAVFRSFPEVDKSSVHVVASSARKRFLSSDGGVVVEPSRVAVLTIACQSQASDGMSVERSAFVASKNGGTFSEDAAVEAARTAAKDVVALRKAPVAEDYSGPVLFEGRAAAELAFELLGDSLSGTPAPDGNDELESPLSRKLGKHVMPSGFSVVDDPGLTQFGGAPLLGHYAVDDEGIAAEKVTLIEDGKLRGFLMSRAPRRGIEHSNGHGRSGLVGWARGYPGNLVVSKAGGLSRAALRAELLAVVREQDAPYGMVITELKPRTSASNGDAIPSPEMAYEVTPDGKQTLVRGAQLSSMSVRDMRDILAAGREGAVYSFVSESDEGLDTAVSVVAPALLFEDLDVRAARSPNARPPVVAKPLADDRAQP